MVSLIRLKHLALLPLLLLLARGEAGDYFCPNGELGAHFLWWRPHTPPLGVAIRDPRSLVELDQPLPFSPIPTGEQVRLQPQADSAFRLLATYHLNRHDYPIAVGVGLVRYSHTLQLSEKAKGGALWPSMGHPMGGYQAGVGVDASGERILSAYLNRPLFDTPSGQAASVQGHLNFQWWRVNLSALYSTCASGGWKASLALGLAYTELAESFRTEYYGLAIGTFAPLVSPTLLKLDLDWGSRVWCLGPLLQFELATPTYCGCGLRGGVELGCYAGRGDGRLQQKAFFPDEASLPLQRLDQPDGGAFELSRERHSIVLPEAGARIGLFYAGECNAFDFQVELGYEARSCLQGIAWVAFFNSAAYRERLYAFTLDGLYVGGHLVF